MQSSGIITLLTDFGQTDGYVGAMKGVILNIFPKAQCVDITHEIKPGSIDRAAYVLHSCAGYFPTGTVHVVVIDPGVGSTRRPITCQTERYYYVAPDNGVLEFIYRVEKQFIVYHLTKREFFLPQISNTFHGRDIFAPVGARLAAGANPEFMGKPIVDFTRLKIAAPIMRENQITGQVAYIDRFGNLISSISEQELFSGNKTHADFVIHIETRMIKGLSKSYSAARSGEVLALIGSSGYLEIAIRDGSAADQLHACIGMIVKAEW